jgi:hypothetical protein
VIIAVANGYIPIWIFDLLMLILLPECGGFTTGRSPAGPAMAQHTLGYSTL